jgi:molybdate transport system ATP-binding protein
MMIEVDVQKRLSDDFTLKIAFAVEGGITVLEGKSGAGKTTSLQLIAGILKPDQGHIRVGEETYFDSRQSIDLSIQKRRIGFVFQDYALFPHFSAEKNIRYGIKDGKARSERTRELLALFRIEHLRNRLPREMSGGEQQRVAVARALASDPFVVLLDEPLSAVDAETRSTLLEEIQVVQRQTRIPFIYVTHNQAEAERLADQRIVLKNDGRFSIVVGNDSLVNGA